MRHLARAYEAFGRDDRRMVDSARYFGDNVRRIAASQMAFFRREIVDPLVASGRPLREVVEAVNPLIGDVIRPAVRELLIWLHRRHIDAINMQFLVQMVEATLQESGVEVPRDPKPPAIAFLDLSGFTRLTDEAGDEQAVTLASTLSDLVSGVALHHGGSVVKLLGDGVMFQFADPAACLRCALELVPRAGEAGLPPARVGVHAGPVVFRDGDYFGRTVNVAARVADYARPREVLVSQAVVDAAGELEGISLDPIGPVALKGVAEPVGLFSARSAG